MKNELSNSEDDADTSINNRALEEVMQDVVRNSRGSSGTCW